LHLQRTRPGLVDALLLQSGSFFTDESDPQERGFAYFAQVTEFVAGVHADGCPAVLTCGTVEENLANNERMANKLGAVLHRRRDAHNYTAWRDALHPSLGELIADAS
jgi:enterochelin esterase family protein